MQPFMVYVQWKAFKEGKQAPLYLGILLVCLSIDCAALAHAHSAQRSQGVHLGSALGCCIARRIAHIAHQ
eukprot:1157486-Pelagomonas_calceolata.AAC.11